MLMADILYYYFIQNEFFMPLNHVNLLNKVLK